MRDVSTQTDGPTFQDASTLTMEHLDNSYLAEQKAKDAAFYRKIPGDYHPDLAIVSVSHFFPGRDVYFDELKKRGDLASIVLKGSSNNEATREEFGEKYNFQLSKEDANDTRKVLEVFNKYIDREKKIIILDHGGYFASNIAQLQQALNGRILGVMEHTQNGHDRYKKEGERVPVPVVSIADCDLKNLVEPAIGASVVSGTETALRENGVTLHDKKSLVLGYGKVGEAIADKLPQGVTQVYDIDALRKIKAIQSRRNLVKAPDRVNALKNADIIFCAGGRNALQESDYAHMKDGVFIATVTSRDDALHMPPSSYQLVRKPLDNNPIYTYVNRDTDHTVYLVNDGNAANFIGQKSAVGSSVLAVLGAEITAMEQIYSERDTLKNGLQNPSRERQIQVAESWIEMLG
jgi:adenosylhomocysteinase